MLDRIGEISHKQSEFTAEWRIPDILSLPEDKVYCSGEFMLEGTLWKLALHPKGDSEDRDSGGWIALYLYKKKNSPVTVDFSLGVRKADGTEEIRLLKVSRTFSVKEDIWGKSKFLKRTDLLNHWTVLAPLEVLTITCTIKKDGLLSTNGKFYCTELSQKQKSDTDHRTQEIMKRKEAFLSALEVALEEQQKEILYKTFLDNTEKALSPNKLAQTATSTPLKDSSKPTEAQRLEKLVTPTLLGEPANPFGRDRPPERVEYENSVMGMSEEELLTSELEEELLTSELEEEDLGLSQDLATSEDEYSDMSTESDEEAFAEELEKSSTADETRKLAETWNRKYSAGHSLIESESMSSSSSSLSSSDDEGSETEIGTDTSEDIDSDAECSLENSENMASTEQKSKIQFRFVLKQTCGENLYKDHKLNGSKVYMGRSSLCHIPLATSGISLTHCVLTNTDEGWRVMDLLSFSGTYVNGRKLEPYENFLLKLGDIIVLGPPSMPQAFFYQQVLHCDDDAIELPEQDIDGQPLWNCNKRKRNQSWDRTSRKRHVKDSSGVQKSVSVNGVDSISDFGISHKKYSDSTVKCAALSRLFQFYGAYK